MICFGIGGYDGDLREREREREREGKEKQNEKGKSNQ